MFSIKEINKDAIEDISALLQRNYNYETVNYFKAHFVWVFSNDKYKIIGAYEGNQLIALRPAIGWNLSMNRKRLCLYQLTGTIVHEDFRRQGLEEDMSTEKVLEVEVEIVQSEVVNNVA